MSIVGTRPPTLDEWNKYELHHRARLAIKPGITGMWQVSGRSEITDFEIYFQPKISLHNYKIVGAEALVRWRRPDGIVVRPEHFLPFYEKNGKIVELDFYVFEQVAAFLEKTKRSGITPVPVSVNVSALHAEDPQTKDG